MIEALEKWRRSSARGRFEGWSDETLAEGMEAIAGRFEPASTEYGVVMEAALRLDHRAATWRKEHHA